MDISDQVMTTMESVVPERPAYSISWEGDTSQALCMEHLDKWTHGAEPRIQTSCRVAFAARLLGHTLMSATRLLALNLFPRAQATVAPTVPSNTDDLGANGAHLQSLADGSKHSQILPNTEQEVDLTAMGAQGQDEACRSSAMRTPKRPTSW